MQERTKKINTKEKNKGLFNSFLWFEREIADKIKFACTDFWESNIETRLYSITESDSIKKDFTTKHDSFYTHKIQTNINNFVIVRFSSEFVESMLNDTLGKTDKDFSLFDLTDLEVKILNSCASFIVKNFEQYFVQNKKAGSIIQDVGNYNLTILVRKNGDKVSKIVVTLPKNLISPKIVNKTKNFVTDDFLKIPVFADFIMGKTKISLSGLKNIAEGDYILLEESQSNIMHVKVNEVVQQANIKPDLSLVEDLPEADNNGKGDSMTKNIWDDIQVDVSAEFQNIKMSLGDLKQISNGIVIDIDDVFNGKVNLVVEDKVVARGDLVIINDKYGVRIDEVVPSVQSQRQAPQAQAPQIKPAAPNARPVQQPQAQAPQRAPQPEPGQARQAAPDETENFDYSNFEEDEVQP